MEEVAGYNAYVAGAGYQGSQMPMGPSLSLFLSFMWLRSEARKDPPKHLLLRLGNEAAETA